VLGALVTKLNYMSPPGDRAGYQAPGYAKVLWPVILLRLITNAIERKRSPKRYIVIDESREMHYFADFALARQAAQKIANRTGERQVFQDWGCFQRHIFGGGYTHRMIWVEPLDV
jgi:hypothetical protein